MHATFEFLEDLDIYKEEKPYEIWAPNNTSLAPSKCHFKTRNIKLISARELDELEIPDFKKCGFEWVSVPEAMRLSRDEFRASNDKIDDYLEKVVEFTKEKLGAENVICFDWRVRRRSNNMEEFGRNLIIGNHSIASRTITRRQILW